MSLHSPLMNMKSITKREFSYLLCVFLFALLSSCAYRATRGDLLSTEEIKKEDLANTAPTSIGDDFDLHGFVPNLPITFSRIDYDSAGKGHLGGAMNIGYSLMYLWAEGTVASKDNYLLRPQFGIGLTGNTGLLQDPNNPSTIMASLSGGVIIGFSGIAFTSQFDILTKRLSFGFSQTFGAGSLINKLTAFDVHITKKSTIP